MNLHAEMLMNCVLAGREDLGHSKIHEYLSKLYDEYFGIKITDFIGLGDKTDFGYVLILPEKIIVAVSGTIGPLLISDAWRDNFYAIPVNGIHKGWNNSWYDLFAEPIRRTIKSIKIPTIPIKLTGLSRGHAISQRGALWLREELNIPDVEHVGYVGPKLTTRKGCERMKRSRVRSTRWYNDGILRDPVDNVGVLGGKHYGLAIKLPDPPNDIPVMDHDYSNVCDAMTIQYKNWGMIREMNFCSNLKVYCKRIGE